MLLIPVEEYGYGFFPGGDPRKFSPDSDATPGEIENHRLACETWDRREQNSRPDCTRGEGFILTTCQFGLGTYSYTEHVGPLEWLRYVAIPEARGALWRWWEWKFKPEAVRAWRGEGA